MNDTSESVRRLLRDRYAQLTGAERLMMGASMFDSARTLALASFPRGLSPRETKRRLCERFYGRQLAERVYGRDQG